LANKTFRPCRVEEPLGRRAGVWPITRRRSRGRSGSMGRRHRMITDQRDSVSHSGRVAIRPLSATSPASGKSCCSTHPRLLQSQNAPRPAPPRSAGQVVTWPLPERDCKGTLRQPAPRSRGPACNLLSSRRFACGSTTSSRRRSAPRVPRRSSTGSGECGCGLSSGGRRLVLADGPRRRAASGDSDGRAKGRRRGEGEGVDGRGTR